MIARRLALALVVLVGCEAVLDAWATGERLSERCSPGVTEEEREPLTDAKITSTLKVWDAIIATKAEKQRPVPGKEEELLIAPLEAGGMGCGQQIAVWGKLVAAHDRVRERRGLPVLEGKRKPSMDSRAAEHLTDDDVALVDARFDEIDAALQRFLAEGKSSAKSR